MGRRRGILDEWQARQIAKVIAGDLLRNPALAVGSALDNVLGVYDDEDHDSLRVERALRKLADRIHSGITVSNAIRLIAEMGPRSRGTK